MPPFEIVLLLLAAVVLSSVIARTAPLPVPVPLVQIAIGALMGTVADLPIHLDPDVFFVLFLPPLLFFDAWRIPKKGLLRDKGKILSLALGLVIATVGGVGLLVHWMIPAMPLAVAFALAAVISPTDPVAISSIASRTPVPKRVMSILEGEALFNDASGLVCMRFAIVAALTGSFSMTDILGNFIWLVAGGLFIGCATTLVVVAVKEWLSLRYGEDTELQILVSLLIPFGAYMLADASGCSGILAAVAGGITMGQVEQRGGVLAITRVRRNIVWETVQFGASGIIFILLGEQLPQIAVGAAGVVREAGHREVIWLAAYVAVIIGALAALRFAWVWVVLRWTLFRGLHQGRRVDIQEWRLVAAMSLAGVRGTVTLAGVFTLPLTLMDGRAFPTRDLAIFLAAGVIIASLTIANVTLPRLFRGLVLSAEEDEEEIEDVARIRSSEAAIGAIMHASSADPTSLDDAGVWRDARARVFAAYRQRIDAHSKDSSTRSAAHKIDEVERRLWLIGCLAERQEIFRLSRGGRLSDDTARKLVREVDLLEARIRLL